MKMLVAVDGSEYTNRVLDYLGKHPAWLASGNQIAALTVVQAVPAHAASFLPPAVLQGYYDDSAKAVLAPVQDFFRKCGVTVRLDHCVGHAAEAIARHAAKHDVDLIVMGSHGHGTFTNLVLGSTATKVLASCKTPVLIVR
jgi:nucleotide-binding universal stress UspA family protein